MRKAIEIKKQEEKERERINELYKKLPNKSNTYTLNYEQRVCARRDIISEQVHRNKIFNNYEQNTNSSKLQNNIDNTKPSIYGDTSQQLYYYTTNKSNSYKASISAHSNIDNNKPTIYSYTGLGNRIKQIDKESKEQRRKDLANSSTAYTTNTKQKIIYYSAQDVPTDYDKIFVIAIVILPFLLYLIMK